MRSCALLLAGVVMVALGVNAAAAADGATLYAVTYVEVMPPSTAEAAALLRRYRATAGPARIEILQRVDRANHFAIVGAWPDQSAFAAHAAAAGTELRDKLRPLLASPPDERVHHALTVGPGPAAAGALYAVTHVDVVPPRKDDGAALLLQYAAGGRQEAANVRLDVVQQTSRPNHFTVVEAWTDRAAFDAHGMTSPTRRFREQLAPMSGALYDERLYAPLP